MQRACSEVLVMSKCGEQWAEQMGYIGPTQQDMEEMAYYEELREGQQAAARLLRIQFGGDDEKENEQ